MEQRSPITPGTPPLSQLKGYVFQTEGDAQGLVFKGSYDLRGFPENSDWGRFELFFDGSLFRILAFKMNSRTTLYQGSFDPEKGCFQYGLKTDPEISLVDTPEDADLSNFVLLGKDEKLHMLFGLEGDARKYYDFPFDPNRKAFRPSSEEQPFSALELIQNSKWPGWQTTVPKTLLYKLWSLGKENSTPGDQPGPGIVSGPFAIIPHKNAFRLYTLESNSKSTPVENTQGAPAKAGEQADPPNLESQSPPSKNPIPSVENQNKCQSTFETTFPIQSEGETSFFNPQTSDAGMDVQTYGLPNSKSNFPNQPDISLDSEINAP